MSAGGTPRRTRTGVAPAHTSSPPATPGGRGLLSAAGKVLLLLALMGAAASLTTMILGSNWDGAIRFAVVIALLLFARWAYVPPSFLGVFAVLLLFATWAGVAHWYRQLSLLDVVVHFFTPGSLAAVAYFIVARAALLPDIRDMSLGNLRPWAPAAWVTSLGSTAAVVWEIYEWVMEQWTPAQIHVGYTDTVIDLSAGMLGSLGAGAVALRWRRHYHHRHLACGSCDDDPGLPLGKRPPSGQWRRR